MFFIRIQGTARLNFFWAFNISKYSINLDNNYQRKDFTGKSKQVRKNLFKVIAVRGRPECVLNSTPQKKGQEFLRAGVEGIVRLSMFANWPYPDIS